jgi:hypothetical protein
MAASKCNSDIPNDSVQQSSRATKSKLTKKKLNTRYVINIIITRALILLSLHIQ